MLFYKTVIQNGMNLYRSDVLDVFYEAVIQIGINLYCFDVLDVVV